MSAASTLASPASSEPKGRSWWIDPRRAAERVPPSPAPAGVCAPGAAVVFVSDQAVTRPPSALPRPLTSIVLPPKRRVRSVDVMVTSPPRAWSAPRASIVPICPTRSPSLLTWPRAPPRAAGAGGVGPRGAAGGGHGGWVLAADQPHHATLVDQRARLDDSVVVDHALEHVARGLG